MKGITKLPVLLAVLTLVSCGASKSVTRNKMNLKGKVESVKVSEFADVGSTDMGVEVFNDAVNAVNKSMRMFNDSGINWDYLNAYFRAPGEMVFDKNGYVIAETLQEKDDVIKTVRTFDKDGNMISEIATNNNKYTVEIANKWEKGLLVESESLDYYAKQDKHTVAAYKYEYDGRNLVKTTKTSDGKEFVTEYVYDKDGVVVCEMYYENTDLTSVKVNTVYGGKTVKTNYVMLDGSDKYTKEYKYLNDKVVEYGYSDQRIEHMKHGTKTLSSDRQYQYEFDGENLIGVSSKVTESSSIIYDKDYSDKLRADFDYEKFKHMFNDEMAKQNKKSEDKLEMAVDEAPKKIFAKKDKVKVDFDQKLKSDVEYEKFKEVFEREMKEFLDDNDKQSGKKLAKKYKPGNVPSVTKAKYSYNEYNDIATMTFCDERDEIEYVYNISYEYDENGNWTTMTIRWEDKPLFVKERVITYF